MPSAECRPRTVHLSGMSMERGREERRGTADGEHGWETREMVAEAVMVGGGWCGCGR